MKQRIHPPQFLSSSTEILAPIGTYYEMLTRPLEAMPDHIPDDNTTPHTLKTTVYSENITMPNSGGLFMHAPFSMHEAIRWYNFDPTTQTFNLNSEIFPDEDLSQQFLQGRVIGGGMDLISNTIASGVFTVQGTFNAITARALPDLTNATPATITSYRADEKSVVANQPVAKQIKTIAPPTDPSDFRYFDDPSIQPGDAVLYISTNDTPVVYTPAQIAAGFDHVTVANGLPLPLPYGQIHLEYEGDIYINYPAAPANSAATITLNVNERRADPVTGALMNVLHVYTQVYNSKDVLPAPNRELTFNFIVDDYFAGEIDDIYVAAILTGPYTSAVTGQGTGWHIECRSYLEKYYKEPCNIVAYSGVSPGSSMSLSAMDHWEVIPDSDLGQNLKTFYNLESRAKFEMAMNYFIQGIVEGPTRTVYSHEDWVAFRNSDYYMPKPDSIVYSAATRKFPHFRAFLEKMWSGIKPYVPSALGGLAAIASGNPGFAAPTSALAQLLLGSGDVTMTQPDPLSNYKAATQTYQCATGDLSEGLKPVTVLCSFDPDTDYETRAEMLSLVESGAADRLAALLHLNNSTETDHCAVCGAPLPSTCFMLLTASGKTLECCIAHLLNCDETGPLSRALAGTATPPATPTPQYYSATGPLLHQLGAVEDGWAEGEECTMCGQRMSGRAFSLITLEGPRYKVCTQHLEPPHVQFGYGGPLERALAGLPEQEFHPVTEYSCASRAEGPASGSAFDFDYIEVLKLQAQERDMQLEAKITRSESKTIVVVHDRPQKPHKSARKNANSRRLRKIKKQEVWSDALTKTDKGDPVRFYTASTSNMDLQSVLSRQEKQEASILTQELGLRIDSANFFPYSAGRDPLGVAKITLTEKGDPGPLRTAFQKLGFIFLHAWFPMVADDRAFVGRVSVTDRPVTHEGHIISYTRVADSEVYVDDFFDMSQEGMAACVRVARSSKVLSAAQGKVPTEIYITFTPVDVPRARLVGGSYEQALLCALLGSPAIYLVSGTKSQTATKIEAKVTLAYTLKAILYILNPDMDELANVMAILAKAGLKMLSLAGLYVDTSPGAVIGFFEKSEVLSTHIITRQELAVTLGLSSLSNPAVLPRTQKESQEADENRKRAKKLIEDKKNMKITIADVEPDGSLRQPEVYDLTDTAYMEGGEYRTSEDFWDNVPTFVQTWTEKGPTPASQQNMTALLKAISVGNINRVQKILEAMRVWTISHNKSVSGVKNKKGGGPGKSVKVISGGESLSSRLAARYGSGSN